MNLDFFQGLTIINSILIAALPIAFFRRQKLQEIKYQEIMELNIKTHDITQRADRSVKEKEEIDKKDYERLDYLISRYAKHSKKISDKILEYKKAWDYAIHESKKTDLDKTIIGLLNRSKEIRNLSDKLLK